VTSRIEHLVGAEFPLFAFSHCRDVVAAVSRAGGFGVLGGSGFTPETLEEELNWIDDHVDGKPYGVDILIPENVTTARGMTGEEIAATVPAAHREFAQNILSDAGIDSRPEGLVRTEMSALVPEAGEKLLEVAFRHPIRLIANALGIAPPSMIDYARKAGVPVAALVGAKEHAIRQAKAGVDIVVAQGTEAGGHCGEVSTLVLIPEIVKALEAYGSPPVLAAGGIMTGAQMAGLMAMGAAGAWTGSVWLTTAESEVSEIVREKLVAAGSRDTIRSTFRTGKPSRQLRSAWHDAWHGPESPGYLGMPQMTLLSQPCFQRIDKAAIGGNPKARELVSYFVGQGIGLVDQVRSASGVVQEFKEDYLIAIERLNATLE
jgi:NAD(P)H-dependent flavin oxidoreductase YrpB (nitropropane dioxygenase family)